MTGPNEPQNVLKVLHLEDNYAEIKKVRDALAHNPLDYRFEVESATNPTQFGALFTTFFPDLVIADIRLTARGEEGIALVETLRREHPEVVVVVRSSLDDVRTVRKSLLAGADDFLSKQCDHAELSLRVINAYRLTRLKRGQGLVPARHLQPGSPAGHPAPTARASEAGGIGRALPSVVGRTTHAIAAQIPGLVQSAVTSVHVLGESGTGKEKIADLFAAHVEPRPFVRVNCGSISPTLLESELFGHAKGAFTGAAADKRGFIEEAHGGWLFLDEVASLSVAAQVALLRVLENHEVTRVGETRPRKVDVRVISASNEPLADLVAQGRFRKDLWQRFREVEFQLPPLRERAEEIPALVNHFCQTMERGPYQITQAALDALCAYPWKDGNVRELRNCLRAMTSMHANKLLTPLSIPERVWNGLAEPNPHASCAQEAPNRMAGADAPVVAQRSSGVPMDTSPQPDRINMSVQLEGAPLSEGWTVPFELLTNLLFAEAVKHVARNGKIPSMRHLARVLALSPSTVPRRLQILVQEGVMTQEEISRLIE